MSRGRDKNEKGQCQKVGVVFEPPINFSKLVIFYNFVKKGMTPNCIFANENFFCRFSPSTKFTPKHLKSIGLVKNKRFYNRLG